MPADPFYFRGGVAYWLHILWNVDFAHGTQLVESMQEAASGKYAVSPVDADMVLDKLVEAGWIRRFDHPPTTTLSQQVWSSYGTKYVPSSCHYGYSPVRESGFRVWVERPGGLVTAPDRLERQAEVMSTVKGKPVIPTVSIPTARILDISAAKYHTDPIDPKTPSLSNSIASTLVIDCPYIAWLAHPRLGNVPTPPTKSMELGVLRHAATLEAGRGIKPLPFDDWRTKAAKEARDDARADGLLPMLEREYEPLMAIGQDVRETLADIGMPLRGKSEVVVTWHEESRRGPVLCRAMMDHLIVDPHAGEIIDLKFISSADLKTCVQHTFALGYDMQAACYGSAIEKLYPHLAGRIRFRFAFIQIMSARSPRRVLITPVELNGEFQILGRERWGRAVETWKRCLDTDQWPGYVPDGHVERVAPMPWMLTGEMDQQRNAAVEDTDENEADES